jgi:competence protein ComGC
MNKLKKHLKDKKGFVVIKNIIGLVFVWSLLLVIPIEINKYFLCKQFEKQSKEWIINSRTLEEIEKDNDKKREISMLVVKLAQCPNLQTIDLDNQIILSYTAENRVKDVASFLESRTKSIKQLKQDGKELYHLLENVKTKIINPDFPDLISSYDLPKNFDKDLLEKASDSIIVEGTLRIFDKQSGREIVSQDIRNFVILTRRKPDIEKPYFYLIETIVSLDVRDDRE